MTKIESTIRYEDLPHDLKNILVNKWNKICNEESKVYIRER